MSAFEQFGQSLRERWEDLTEGWEQLWRKTRNALTRFSPPDGTTESDLPAPVSRSGWGLLSAEVEENDAEVRVRVEVPGLNASDLNLEVRDDSLVISGEKRYSNESFSGRVYLMETAYGRFQRVIPLPASVDDGAAKASYRNGVLEVKLPKTSKSGGSRIVVES